MYMKFGSRLIVTFEIFAKLKLNNEIIIIINNNDKDNLVVIQYTGLVGLTWVSCHVRPNDNLTFEWTSGRS